jgi:hypothetical protein
VLQPNVSASDALEHKMNATVRSIIGAHAKVDLFQFVPGLPKTRSGKVMRRILRKVAEGDPSNLGDITTLADPSVVEKLRASGTTPQWSTPEQLRDLIRSTTASMSKVILEAKITSE